MKTKTQAPHDRQKLPTTYRELCDLLLPCALHDDIELGNMQEIVDILATLPSRNTAQQDYLETLTELIESYESHAVPIRKPSGLETLKFLLAERKLTASDLSRLLGKDISLGYRILGGERRLTVQHIRRLAEHFSVSPAVFI